MARCPTCRGRTRWEDPASGYAKCVRCDRVFELGPRAPAPPPPEAGTPKETIHVTVPRAGVPADFREAAAPARLEIRVDRALGHGALPVAWGFLVPFGGVWACAGAALLSAALSGASSVREPLVVLAAGGLLLFVGVAILVAGAAFGRAWAQRLSPQILSVVGTDLRAGASAARDVESVRAVQGWGCLDLEVRDARGAHRLVRTLDRAEAEGILRALGEAGVPVHPPAGRVRMRADLAAAEISAPDDELAAEDAPQGRGATGLRGSARR